MTIFYKIEYNTSASYFKNIINTLIKESKINAFCKQYKGFILIKCDDESSKIEEFFKLLEYKLPLSIFLGKSYLIENFDESLEELKEDELKEERIILTNDYVKDIIKNNEVDFLKDVLSLVKGEVLDFETSNSLKHIFLENKAIREKFENDNLEVKLLITNLNKINEILEINSKDLQLLCSCERPLLKLKFKLLVNKDKTLSSTNFIYAKLPDDENSILLSQALQKEGISYVLYAEEKIKQEDLKLTYFNERNLIISGDRFLFPKFDYLANKSFDSSKSYFKENKGVYKSILAQENKRLLSSIGVYFSSKKDSGIFINLPTKGLKEVILVPNIENSIDKCLEEIEQIDEHCKRLVQNYKPKFSSFFKDDVRQDTKSFESIMNMCAKVLGMSNAKEFQDMALSLSIKSGIQIDMKLLNIDGKNYLDYRRIVQSIMAYKMADVDNGTLAYSFFESLSEFIVNYVNEIAKTTKAKDIVLCGDMFSNSIVLSKTHKNLIKTYNVILPKEYPLDY